MNKLFPKAAPAPKDYWYKEAQKWKDRYHTTLLALVFYGFIFLVGYLAHNHILIEL